MVMIVTMDHELYVDSNSNSSRRRPTRRRNHAFVALAFLVLVQQQWLIFLAGTTVAASAAAVSVSSTSSLAPADGDEDEEATADDYSTTVAVVTSHTYGAAKDNRYAPMEGEVISNGGRTNDEGADGAVSATDDVEAAQQHEHGHHGGAAHVADDGELILRETTLASSPPDKALGGEKVAADDSILSFDNGTPKIDAADDEQLPGDFDSDSDAHVAVDGDNSISSMVDHSNDIHDNAQLSTTTVDKHNQRAIEGTANPPNLEDHPPTMHPTTTTIADTATTVSITSSSDNPTIIVSSANEDAGSESNKDYSTTTTTTTYERIMYNSLFQSNNMEYDMMKFDPFSFSGAPLGGWGRATRSRLATLPLRLVQYGMILSMMMLSMRWVKTEVEMTAMAQPKVRSTMAGKLQRSRDRTAFILTSRVE
jgi:hypothetical protein